MIIIKAKNEIDKMRRGGKILGEIMDELARTIVPGKNTFEIDELAEKLIRSRGGFPIFKGQGEKNNPYPATICASINSEIVHGIPSVKKIIQTGDLFKIDIGMRWENMITDMARTFEVGKVSFKAQKLKEVTKEALQLGIKKIKARIFLEEYSSAVEKYVKKNGFSIVRDLVGHGVGRKLHEDPQIPNFKNGLRGPRLLEGMTLALEPMINAGTAKTKILKDGWTFVTDDGELSAHFENTILVKKNGVEILTPTKLS
ncbi:MAG: type I methionyl aminopeptidase [Candidatus Moranbacteria bacterium CG_4_8_14_3_um_filter_34_16]|nr:MAG: type I methionyl aminopeptidase [Candidatus Moranbacteria bacterium CG08_land_8_20_14_0_20_34_16]PIW94924.1 MAG: type I methionyl aminopeptidase [Candidatus Moranbacteria bacterium CG_4_8_14_3_um_filter_34_16]PJA89158.1 MAG: type I methionyl aminopeptidase [Candidatus Moranbacteria bacterium CG_4_9_14_3_um_filter_33_15]